MENISSPKLHNTPMNPHRRLHANNGWSTAKYDSDRLSRESHVDDEKIIGHTLLGQVAGTLSSIPVKSRSESADAAPGQVAGKLSSIAVKGRSESADTTLGQRNERVTHPMMEDEWMRKYSPARTDIEREQSQREARDSLMDDDPLYTGLNDMLDGLPDKLSNMILVGDATGPGDVTRVQG